ncbi:hypothetical protein DYB28_001991 [Aphanomyces astaci]|nr:hypothetical protein DYB25_008308 [Aphanomyces astaci]RHZ31014.1 hypothetical protein DYB31_010535 [Aphanomyces astaci]RLO00173.1 hypothetical protein DYB28_001991 [Aphanomyces astaci]
MTAQCHELEAYTSSGKRYSVRHVLSKPVFATSTARNFVVVTMFKEDGGGGKRRFVIASRSLTSHASAPESKQYVGGINHPSGYVVDEMPDDLSCRVTMVAQLDLGGMLPALVMNALAVDAPFKLL